MSPDRIVALSALDGLLLTSLPGANVPWSADPLVVGSTRFAVATSPAQLAMVDISRQTVVWRDSGFDHSAFAPLDVFGNSKSLLKVNDGLSVMRLLPETGRSLWTEPTRAGAAAIVAAHEVSCCDATQFYIPSGGILRCFSLENGRLIWEQVLGDSSARWSVLRLGRGLAAWPASPAADPALIVCDPVTGQFIQRLSLGQTTGQIEIVSTSPALVLATGQRLVSFAPNVDP